MNPLTTFVRSMGNDRALANARAALDVRRREDWLVLGLAHRLEQAPARPAAAPPATTSRVA